MANERIVHLHLPLTRPEDVIPHLGKGELHWKEGRSARCLAEQWFAAHGLPDTVSTALRSDAMLCDAELLDAWLERKTPLPWGAGAPTQTDLLALLRLTSGGLAVLGVEAKVTESFGPRVDDWLAQGGNNRRSRLAGLCGLFGIDPATAGLLRYQLFHRTAGTLLEARRFGISEAALVVQSWCPIHTGLTDFRIFACAIGFGEIEPGRLSEPRMVEDINLRLGWIADSTIARP